MIVEMRTYRTRPGLRERFLQIFRKLSMPEHARLGMPIAGPFVSVEDSDLLIFLRGFSDLASREALKAQFYEGRLWKEQLEETVMPMLERFDVVLVDDPDDQLGLSTRPSPLSPSSGGL